MLVNLRNALMAGKRLPYDAELEYLESTGTQWIDTGIIGGSSSKVEISASSSNTALNMGLFGSRNASLVKAFIIWQRVTNTSVRFDFADNSANRVIANAAWDTSGFNTVIKDGPNNTLNGVAGANNATATFTCEYPFYLFSINTAGTATSNASVRIYSCKIWQNGVLVRDFIPVRKGTVGYMYDRVSGKLFGNAGTGDFVLGPDVVPVEYIESHGTEWIDTGVVPNDMAGFRVDAMARGSNGNVRILGVYETISGQMRRFASVLRSAGSYSQGYYFGWGAAYNFTASESNFNKRRLMELNYLNSREMAFDGAVVQSNLPALPTFTTSAYLFGNRNETPLTAMRCYQCQMSEGSSLSRSYYSVRVGTEGAMMDVLTRRIYRNAGTGAFGYGNDLKYPIPAE